jgi:bifunctional non-homologous end joining protein LigD
MRPYVVGSRSTGQGAVVFRPPSGPLWSHEIKFDGYHLIARKDGDQVRLWTGPGSDYSARFTRIMEAVAALPVARVVLDGELSFCGRTPPATFSRFDRRKGNPLSCWSRSISWSSTARTCAGRPLVHE